MRILQVSGVLPGSMAENSRPGDWSAMLALAGDLSGLTRVELLGRDALAFSASLLPGLSALVLTPGAPADFEALLAAGRSPDLTFSLAFTFADGTRVEDPTPRSVTLLDRDDTPPSGLAFLSGGTVMAGAIGAAIGTLAVTDPDSAGPFTFSFPEEDAWRFEVVGSVLKLRDGISLGLDDMPRRPLIIEVSDGRQSAAFLLELRVTDPATRLAELPPGETRGGFQMAGEETVLALRESRAVAQAEALAGGERLLTLRAVTLGETPQDGLQVTLREGLQVTLPPAERVTFVDGFQDAGPESPGVLAAALVRALTGQAADGRTLAGMVARAETGATWTDIAGTALGALPNDPAEAVTMLYRNALGRDPAAEEIALETARLATGITRAQLAVDIALGAESLARQPATGVWVADPLGEDGAWRGGTGGLPGTAGVPATAPDMVWLL